MADRILVVYGSYRSDRMGIRLADYLVAGLKAAARTPSLSTPRRSGCRARPHVQGARAGFRAPRLGGTRIEDSRRRRIVFVAGEYNGECSLA